MHIDPEDLIDIDGCSQGKEDYFCRYGYSPRGKECVVNQIVVLGKSYSCYSWRLFVLADF